MCETGFIGDLIEGVADVRKNLESVEQEVRFKGYWTTGYHSLSDLKHWIKE